MALTIIGLSQRSFEPDIILEEGRDGISSFQFSVVGTGVSGLYTIDQVVSDVPNQPAGSFKVVRRSLETIAGSLQRLRVVSEGGIPSSAYISESGFQYNESVEPGLISIATATVQVTTQYKLSWISPSVTVTTNSSSASSKPAETIARQIIASMQVEIFEDRPLRVTSGKKIDTSDIKITGSSIEKAGGLWRVRATATKGQIPK